MADAETEADVEEAVVGGARVPPDWEDEPDWAEENEVTLRRLSDSSE